jgi:hypothetical protein
MVNAAQQEWQLKQWQLNRQQRRQHSFVGVNLTTVKSDVK